MFYQSHKSGIHLFAVIKLTLLFFSQSMYVYENLILSLQRINNTQQRIGHET